MQREAPPGCVREDPADTIDGLFGHGLPQSIPGYPGLILKIEVPERESTESLPPQSFRRLAKAGGSPYTWSGELHGCRELPDALDVPKLSWG